MQDNWTAETIFFGVKIKYIDHPQYIDVTQMPPSEQKLNAQVPTATAYY